MAPTIPFITRDQRQALAAIADKQAIKQCLATHSRGIDRNDIDLMRSAYFPDATVDYGMFCGSARDLCQFVTEGTRDLPVSLHRPSNIWIRRDSATEARAESYVIAYLELPDTSGAMTQVFVGGRYLDRFEKRAERWKITHRTYVMDWNSTHPSTGSWTTGLGAALTLHGAHRGTDPGTARLAVWSSDFGKPATKSSQGQSPMTATTASAAEIDAILARDAIHQLLVAYCRAVDRGDRDLLRSLWHPDAMVETGLFDGNGLAYSDFVIESTAVLKRSFHSISNEWIEVDGDRAVSECYLIALVTTPSDAGDQDCLLGGRYLDRYERVDGVWKIRKHAFIVDWTINQPSTAIWDDGMFAAMKLRGARGKADPLHLFWPPEGRA